VTVVVMRSKAGLVVVVWSGVVANDKSNVLSSLPFEVVSTAEQKSQKSRFKRSLNTRLLLHYYHAVEVREPSAP